MLKRIIVGSTIAAAGFAAFYSLSRWRATWGIDPAEAQRRLPGDDLVPVATDEDTRGITINAPPSAVWPWLVQMGYGRAGWYSYDRMDMRGRSADEIHPEWQALAVGDVIPTDPGGGFEVRTLEPERSLVVFIDSDLVAKQRGTQALGMPMSDAPGLAASGRVMSSALPTRFAASWAFELEPVGDRQTRLIERVRIGVEGDARGSRAMSAVFGFGVFVMMQRQMRGIRERVEMAAGTQAPASATAGTQPVPVMAPEVPAAG